MFLNHYIKSLVNTIKAGFILSSFVLMMGGLSADDSLLPEITKGKGDSCVEDKDFMRRNHMDMLRHDRDKTVHDGIRGVKHSLKECISCHAIDGTDGKTLTASSSEHFCRSCHDYAAVSIDCFQCHASRPEQKTTKQIAKEEKQQ